MFVHATTDTTDIISLYLRLKMGKKDETTALPRRERYDLVQDKLMHGGSKSINRQLQLFEGLRLFCSWHEYFTGDQTIGFYHKITVHRVQENNCYQLWT